MKFQDAADEMAPSAQSESSFKLFSPRIADSFKFFLPRTTDSFKNKQISLTGATSNLQQVLGAFAKVPSMELWLKSGIVERQTVSADMQWLPRLMILTSDAVLFAKEGSDVILDKLPLKNIAFVG